jgi:hypothetical protein
VTEFNSVPRITLIFLLQDLLQNLITRFERHLPAMQINSFQKIEDLHHNAYSAALQKAKDLCTSVQTRKSREINIKREDAQKFFDRRTKEEEEMLKDYRLRQSLGEDLAIAIRGSERRIEDLRDELKKTLARFEEEELVIERNPELFSAAIIIAKGKS